MCVCAAAAAAGRHEWRDEAGHYGGDEPNTVSCFLSGEVKRNKKRSFSGQ